MRAVIIRAFGPADGLVPVELPDPIAGPGQVVVETEAIGVGGVDAAVRRGTISRPGLNVGHVPGSGCWCAAPRAASASQRWSSRPAPTLRRWR